MEGDAPVVDVSHRRTLILAAELREMAETLEAWVAIVKHD
jgi:hypothetical protein